MGNIWETINTALAIELIWAVDSLEKEEDMHSLML